MRISMKKMLLKWCVAAMVAVLACGCLSSSLVLAAEEADRTSVELGKEKVLQYITQRESEYYTIKSVDCEVGEVEHSATSTSFEVVATVAHELKAASASELPFIRGMMAAVKEKATLSELPGLDNMVELKIKDVENYIGETTNLQMRFYVTVNDLDKAASERVQLWAVDSSGNKVDVSEYDIMPYAEMCRQGYTSVTETIQKARAMGNLSTREVTPVITNYEDYDRIAARDYAHKWYGPSDEDYNPEYSNWNGNGGDCANFVSQCIEAGGVLPDDTWYKDSKIWISTSKLANYMVSKGYATEETYKYTTAGNFATKPGHSVLVTLNNTIDIAYTAHNTNVKDAKFTKTELEEYTFYIIKNY